jgi:thioredoxin 1
MSTIRYIDESSFEAEVLQAVQPVLVDFTAAWCPPCRALLPVLEQLAERRAGRLKVVSVDADGCPELAARLGVRAFPTVVAFTKGREIGRHLGLTSLSKLEKLLDDGMTLEATGALA